jgi:hypothetical protein
LQVNGLVLFPVYCTRLDSTSAAVSVDIDDVVVKAEYTLPNDNMLCVCRNCHYEVRKQETLLLSPLSISVPPPGCLPGVFLLSPVPLDTHTIVQIGIPPEMPTSNRTWWLGFNYRGKNTLRLNLVRNAITLSSIKLMFTAVDGTCF